MIGKESEECPQKEKNKFMMKYEDTVDNLIFLDDEQQKPLNKLDEEDFPCKNFCFQGPSGSGKTIVAIKCCNKLIEKYLKKGSERINVYAIANDDNRCNMQLTDVFEKNIYRHEKVCLKCSMLSEILEDSGIEKANNENYISHLWNFINKRHVGQPCIIIMDECIADTAWTNLHPPGYPKAEHEPASNYPNLISCFSPINKQPYKEYKGMVNAGGYFFTKTFRKRYRNSEKILYLSKFFVEKSNKCIKVQEELVPCLAGKHPIWIDIEGETKPIPFAVDEMKKLISGFQKSQTVLVYDVFLEDAYKANFQEAWANSKTFLTWQQFTGCESDAVVYISNGCAGRKKKKILFDPRRGDCSLILSTQSS